MDNQYKDINFDCDVIFDSEISSGSTPLSACCSCSTSCCCTAASSSNEEENKDK